MTEEAKKIVEALRMCHDPKYGCYDCPVDVPGEPCQNELKAADLIESLSAQLEQVTRERDAAIRDIDRWCGTCKRYYLNDDTGDVCKYAKECNKRNYWQWRGVR